MEVGRDYLLFLEPETHQGWFRVDGCGNSRDVRAAADALAEIEALERAKGRGIIHALVGRNDPLAGFVVTARREDGKAWTAITDASGWVHLAVPLGNYSVVAEKAGARAVPVDMSREDPLHVHIRHSGQSSELQFVTD